MTKVSASDSGLERDRAWTTILQDYICFFLVNFKGMSQEATNISSDLRSIH